MGWGGGMGGGGGFGGGGFGGGGGQGAHGAAASAGLPFAGIPPEYAEKVEKLLADEPEAKLRKIPFSYVGGEQKPFTLRRFLTPHAPQILLAIVLVVLDTATLQIGPLLTQRGIDRGILRQDTGALFMIAMLYLGSIVANSLLGYVRLSFTGRLGQRLMHALRIRVFSHIQRLSIDFFTEEKAGRIMTRMTSDIEALQQLFSDGLINLAVQGITLAFVATVLFTMNAQLALVVLVAIVPVMLVLTLWFRRESDKGYLRVRERIADVLADLQETLSGIRILAMYNRQRHNIIRHRNTVGEHRDANLTTARIAGIYGPGAEAIGVFGQAMILLFGGRMVLRGQLTVGELTAFVLYLNAFFAPIQQLVALHTTYQQGKAAITKLADLFAMAPSVPEKPDAYPLPELQGEIKLEDVTFGYKPGQIVLRDVDITIAAGETFALVGPTGAGKSTIAKLVTRFYDPTSGRVLVDGHDLRDVTFDSLRRQLGVVPQEPFLFAGSIRDNISFASDDASEDEVMEACRAAGIGDLIDRLPQGLDTPCHERGVTLSSGERQLLALARAFLAHPRVLILDEATSSLDLATESKIERALDILLEGRTAILIAHRLNTAMRADRIAVIDDGRVLEMGTHDDLIAQGGRYADMYALWVSQGGAREALAEQHPAGTT